MHQKSWYQLDNVSKVFLATRNNRDTRVMRLGCVIDQDVDEALLSQALLQTIKKRPQFQVRIRRGFFWHYIERTDVLPVVSKESGRICPCLYGKDSQEILHYKVSYYKNRINLDIFHALCDGTGAIEFLNILVLEYLKLVYKGELDGVHIESGASSDELLEDSYRQFYDDRFAKKVHPPKSYRIRRSRLPYDQLQFFEIHMNAKQVKEATKKEGSGITAFFGARLFAAIFKGMPSIKKREFVTLSVPVNLRNFYPSKTIRNFFVSTYVSEKYDANRDMKMLAADFRKKLEDGLTPEKIHGVVNSYQLLERNAFVRVVPLGIKQLVVRAFSRGETKMVSGVISNLGNLDLPEKMAAHVEGYSNFCSHESLFMTVYSYKDEMVLGVSQAFVSTSIVKDFVRLLTDEGIDTEVYASKVIV